MRTKLENLVKTAGRQILSGGGSAVTEKEGIGNYVTELDQQLQESDQIRPGFFRGISGGHCPGPGAAENHQLAAQPGSFGEGFPEPGMLLLRIRFFSYNRYTTIQRQKQVENFHFNGRFFYPLGKALIFLVRQLHQIAQVHLYVIQSFPDHHFRLPGIANITSQTHNAKLPF